MEASGVVWWRCSVPFFLSFFFLLFSFFLVRVLCCCFVLAGSGIAVPKDRTMRLRKEVTSLMSSLPPGVFVRVDENRLDVLRAAIAGPCGTPYQNGLFLFDMYVVCIVYVHSLLLLLLLLLFFFCFREEWEGGGSRCVLHAMISFYLFCSMRVVV